MAFDNYPKNFGIMARLAAPAADADDRQKLEFRRANARRNLRCALTRDERGTYSEGNICNLYEILLYSTVSRPETACGWDRGQADKCCLIIGKVNRMLVERGLPPFTERQINNYFAGVTQAQLDVLVEAIALSDVEIETFAKRERWIHLCDKGDKYIARDSTVANRIWQAAAGMHEHQATDITIAGGAGMSEIKSEIESDIAALDTALCTGAHVAAVEQTLLDEATGVYGYVADGNTGTGTYKVRVWAPEDVDTVVATILARGYSVVGEMEVQPLTEGQKERIARRNQVS